MKGGENPPGPTIYVGVNFDDNIMCGYISEGVPYYYGPADGEVYTYNNDGTRKGSGGGVAPTGGVTWVNGFKSKLESIYGPLENPEVTAPPVDPSEALPNWSRYSVVNY